MARRSELQTGSTLVERMWSRREIENYLVTPDSLQAFVTADPRTDDLLDRGEHERRSECLQTSLDELVQALRVSRRPDPWGADIKVTDEFLDPLFENYFQRLGTPQQIYKRDYHGLADVLPLHQIDPEITQQLDALVAAVALARPAA